MSPSTSAPPTISYGQEREEEKEKALPVQMAKTAGRFLDGVTWAVLAVVLAVWALIGAVFWIPLVLRGLIRFSISHLEAMFENQRPAEAAKVLRSAVGFYRRGFIIAIEMVLREDVEDQSQGPMLENRLLLEVLWAILVWYFIFLGLGWIQASPWAIWQSFTDLPWGEVFATLSAPFRG